MKISNKNKMIKNGQMNMITMMKKNKIKIRRKCLLVIDKI